jgi:hypothetical protein
MWITGIAPRDVRGDCPFSSWFRVPEACALEDDDRDHPLSCHWRPVAPDAFESFDLPSVRSRAAVLGRAQIITEAFVVGRADPDGWISYSRRYEFYAARRSRYWPTTYTFDTIVPTVDQLAAAGLLDHEKMPSGNRGRQSRFRASPELHKRLSDAPLAVLHDPHELVILRDHEGNFVDYSDSERSRRWRRNIEEINEGIMSAAIKLRSGLVRNGDPLKVENPRSGPPPINFTASSIAASSLLVAAFMERGGKTSRQTAVRPSESTVPIQSSWTTPACTRRCSTRWPASLWMAIPMT